MLYLFLLFHLCVCVHVICKASSLYEYGFAYFPLQTMSEFSLPSSIGQKISPLLGSQAQNQLIRTVVWMLRHRLLLQLHTYVYFMATSRGLSWPNAVSLNFSSKYFKAHDLEKQPTIYISISRMDLSLLVEGRAVSIALQKNS